MKRYADTARFLKLTQNDDDAIAAQQLVESVEKLVSDLGLPKNLRDLAVPELDSEKLEQLVALATSDPAMIFNSRQATENDIIRIYEEAY
jgi:alcohol dehydrogenase class IV